MTNPVAEVSDLQARALQPLTDTQLAQAQQWLDDAWGILAYQRPFLTTAVTSNVTLKALVSQIVCAMVLRVFSNPDGKYTETIDNYSFSRDQTIATGLLTPTDAELELIGFGDGAGGGAFTIGFRPYWSVPPAPDPWVPIGDGS